MEQLKKSRLVFAIGKANITDTFDDALKRCRVILDDMDSLKIKAH